MPSGFGMLINRDFTRSGGCDQTNGRRNFVKYLTSDFLGDFIPDLCPDIFGKVVSRKWWKFEGGVISG